MAYAKVYYCTRCDHRDDCHIADGAGSGSCTGRTKKSKVCRCPRYARGLGMDRRQMGVDRAGKRVAK